MDRGSTACSRDLIGQATHLRGEVGKLPGHLLRRNNQAVWRLQVRVHLPHTLIGLKHGFFQA
jgi:hypothetical protein